MLVIAGAGAAVQILPTLEYGHYALRWVNTAKPVNDQMPVPYLAHESLGLKASELPFLILPGSDAIVDPLVGIVPLALAAAALLARPRPPRTGLFAGLALAAVLFSLVRLNPLHGVLYAMVPGLEKARAPIMAMAIGDVALAALAALWCPINLEGSGNPPPSGVPGGRRLIGIALFLMSLYPPALVQDCLPILPSASPALPSSRSCWPCCFTPGTGVMPALAPSVGVLLLLGLFEGYNSSGSQYVHVEDAASIVRPQALRRHVRRGEVPARTRRSSRG